MIIGNEIIMYLPFVDHLIEELTSRLILNEDRFTSQYFTGIIYRRMQIHVYAAYGDGSPAADDRAFSTGSSKMVCQLGRPERNTGYDS